MQTDHLDEERKTLEGYKIIADKQVAGDLVPYLLRVYNDIIEKCLLKHSKHPNSNEVSRNKILCYNFFNVVLFADNAVVGKDKFLVDI